MNWDRVEGNWKQLTGKVKEKWGKLTEDDMTVINGKQDQLVGRIQERYGIAKTRPSARSIAGSSGCNDPQGTGHGIARCFVKSLGFEFFPEVVDGTRGGAVAPGSADPDAPADVGPGLAALSVPAGSRQANEVWRTS